MADALTAHNAARVHDGQIPMSLSQMIPQTAQSASHKIQNEGGGHGRVARGIVHLPRFILHAGQIARQAADGHFGSLYFPRIGFGQPFHFRSGGKTKPHIHAGPVDGLSCVDIIGTAQLGHMEHVLPVGLYIQHFRGAAGHMKGGKRFPDQMHGIGRMKSRHHVPRLMGKRKHRYAQHGTGGLCRRHTGQKARHIRSLCIPGIR